MPKIKKNPLVVYDLMPGCKLVIYDEYNILVGSPCDIVKLIVGKKLPIPTHVLLPDSPYYGTIAQNSTEFLLYYFLFAYQGLAKGKKFTLLGTEEQTKANLELLRIALHGLTREEFEKLYINREITEMLLKEEDFYKLKGKDGKSLQLEDFVCYKNFSENNILEIDDLKIKKTDFNIFEFILENEILNIDINIHSEQTPPFNVFKKQYPDDFIKFGVEIVGSSSGFSPINPCSGLVVSYNCSYILIDPIPYLDYLLKARGISKNQINACFITHIHDDHCVLLPFLFHSRKMKIITTPEIYYMSLYKLALTMNMYNYEEFEKYFEFIPAYPDTEIDFYGMKIIPHYTIHPIPTVGARFIVKDNDGKSYKFTYVADNQSLSIIDGMYEKGIISAERRKKVKELYIEEVDLLIADGGLGMIHGDPRDGKNSKAHKVAFIHLDELPEEYKTIFGLASVGKTYTLIKGTEANRICKTIEYLTEIFPNEIEKEWLPYIMNYDRIVKYNAGDVIIKQGYEENPKTYIILTGYCKVIEKYNKKIEYESVLEAGDIVGEIAIIKEDEKRTATVVAETPVTLCEFDLEAFKSFAVKKELLFKLNNVWSIRNKFSRLATYKQFSSRVITDLAKISKEIIFGSDKTITITEKSNEVFIIIDGEAILRKGNYEINLKKGDVFGDVTFLFDKGINYEVYIGSFLHCIVITTSDMRKFADATPIVNFHLNITTKKFFETLT